MARWCDVEAQAPELAARARACLDAHAHKTIATLRRDGSPRISGTELTFRDGDVWLGSMWRAVKALDLRRDGRFALHSASDDPPGWQADAKLAGVAVEVTDPEVVRAVNGPNVPGGRSHLFRLDVREVVVTRLGEPADHLVIEAWHEGRGITRLRR
ncbi:MAG TPA: pyridoxamine 5'-phosphate oxidase family protein [Solirubrobacteraceae bacterium]|nr:pyridoxamine 5'-phosphate oxidase family protein [Solirubrobacteraceae bacterium]